MSEIRSEGGNAAVRTQAIQVRIHTRGGAEVVGFAHVKPGAYQRRVSDLLNLGKVKYVPITDAEYTVPGRDTIQTGCVLINIDDVVLMDVGSEDIGHVD